MTHPRTARHASKQMFLLGTLALLVTSVPLAGCVATSTSSTTWTAQPGYHHYGRTGRVELIREIVQREEGDPVGGALLGAAIGGIVGGNGGSAVIGAIGGAAIGAAASQGSREHRRYEILVQLDDGGRQMFVYADYCPFQPGQPVVVTPQGLRSM